MSKITPSALSELPIILYESGANTRILRCLIDASTRQNSFQE